MVWSVNVEANILAADPLSPYMAVVDNDQKCKYMYMYNKADDSLQLRGQVLALLFWLCF